MAQATISLVKPFVTRKISQTEVRRAKFIDVPGKTKVSQALPFRVKFINIGINAYGPNNPAPIGIAVVGFNNYVL